MRLLPIQQKLEDNTAFLHLPDEVTYLSMSVSYFEKIGYQPPWIGYFCEVEGVLVGQGAFKGAPVDGKVEIAYNTFEEHQGKGIGGGNPHQQRLGHGFVHLHPKVRRD
jgi:hypothetical protein